MLITIEGIDGAGKTTLATRLAEELGATLLREPGGVALSERIRALVKDPELAIHPRAEALLYAAARVQLVHDEVLPRLDRGETVVLDRFVDSSLAYQGAGRGLGVDAIRAVNEFGVGGLVPDLTLLLRLDTWRAQARLDERGVEKDRMEREGAGFVEAIADAYDRLARAEPGRFRVLDASRSPDAVLEQALAAVRGT